MSKSNPFTKQETRHMPLYRLAEALGMHRNSLYRWEIGLLEGLPRIIMLALKEGKITLDDVVRYRKVAITLKRVMSDAPLEAPAAVVAAPRGLLAELEAARQAFKLEDAFNLSFEPIERE